MYQYLSERTGKPHLYAVYDTAAASRNRAADRGAAPARFRPPTAATACGKQKKKTQTAESTKQTKYIYSRQECVFFILLPLRVSNSCGALTDSAISIFSRLNLKFYKPIKTRRLSQQAVPFYK